MGLGRAGRAERMRISENMFRFRHFGERSTAKLGSGDDVVVFRDATHSYRWRGSWLDAVVELLTLLQGEFGGMCTFPSLAWILSVI